MDKAVPAKELSFLLSALRRLNGQYKDGFGCRLWRNDIIPINL